MPDTITLENKLLSLRALYAEICIEADEDSERDHEERALIDRVGGKIAELDAKIRAQRSAGVEGTRLESEEDDAGKAWSKLAKSYQRLLRLHAGLEKAGVDLAADLDTYLKAISTHVAAEDWASAVNQTVLAILWADERNLWKDYLDDPEFDDFEPTEEDEQSGKAAWEKMGGQALLIDFGDLQEELEELGNPHAGQFATFCKGIRAAVEGEDWKDAVAKAILLHKFIADNNLDPTTPEDDPKENAYPEKDRWESWQFLRSKLATLYEDLVEIDHPLAIGLGAILDKVSEAEAKTEYLKATKLLTEDALKFAEDHDLWSAVKSDDDEEEKTNILPDMTKQMIDKLRTLRKELDRAGHEQAGAFGKLVDRIPDEVPDFSSIMPAARAVEEAWSFADGHSLWDAVGPLPKTEEEALFWEHNGDRYYRLQNLHRSLQSANQEFAPRLGESLAEIDVNIQNDNFYLAGMLVDKTWDLAKKKGMIDEGPKDIWLGLREEIGALRQLSAAARTQDGLRDEGFPHADALEALVNEMNAAEAELDWSTAVQKYKAAKAYADKHDIWSDVGVEPVEVDDADDEDEYPEKTRWEGWQFFREKIKKLYGQLVEIEHPLANRLGAYLDEIDEAEAKKEYQRATDLLVDEAGGFADVNDLWDAVTSEDDNAENLLPSITQEQIAKLKGLSRELSRMGHEKAKELAALVDPIPDHVSEFSRIIPTGRAVEAAWTFADKHALWSALPPLPKGEEERIFWETNGKLYRELHALHRRLEEEGHEKAVRFGEKIAEVDAAIEKDSFHQAALHLGQAVELASIHDLWGDLPASDEDDVDDGEGINPGTASIKGKVGKAGKNRPEDVKTVQLLLNLKGSLLKIDSDCGPRTIAAIEKFQQQTFGWKDGTIDPDGKTFRALTGKISAEDIMDTASEVAKKVSETVKDTAGAIGDAIGDAVEDVSDFIGGFVGGDKGDDIPKGT